MLFLKIFLLIYLSYTLPSSAERRAGEDRENNGTTPRQQKVLFVNICHRYWLFSARGYPHEKSPPFFVHYPENIRGYPCVPPPVMLLPVVWQITSSLSSHLVPHFWLCALLFRPREIPIYKQKIALKCDFSCIYQKKTVPLQRKGQNTLTSCIKIAAMKTSNTPQEMPFGSESGSINNVQKKYYTADEAVAFLEPRIRAMFK
jgi:hypothetical protein